MEIKLKDNSAITLIALIITIIVLLILAAISINSLVGENGIITRASKTKELYNIEMGRERVEIVLSEYDVERLADKLLQDIDRLDGMYNDGKKDWVRKTKDKTENSLIVVDDNNNMYKVTIGEDGKTEVEYIGKDNGEPWPELTLSIRTETETNNLEAYIQVEARENKNGIKSIELIQTGETKTYNGQKTVTDEFKVMQNGIYKVKVTSTKEKVTTKQIEVNVITILSFSEVEWVGGKARVKIESGQTFDTIRYKVEGKSEYETYTEGTYISNLEHEDTVIAQLWNGQEGYGTAGIKIQDTIAPENFTPTVEEIGETSLKINASTIDNQTGIKEYEYYIKKTTESNYQLKSTTSNTSYTVTGLEGGTAYNIKVVAVDNAGNMKEVIITESTDSSKTIEELVSDGTIKIGDYVAYEPTPGTFDWNSKEGGITYATYSGSTNNTTPLTTQTGTSKLNWRVLDITEGGVVRLISDAPTTSPVYLVSYNGYNNAVYLIDKVCSTLYSGDKGTAKNLKIEDIQNKMDLSYWNYTSFSGHGDIGSPLSSLYPAIFAQEKNQKINGITGTKYGLSEQTSLINQTATMEANSWEVKVTRWEADMTPSNFKDDIYNTLFIKSDITDSYYPYYYLSSRCVSSGYSAAGFYVRTVWNGTVWYFSLYHSHNSVTGIDSKLRPVVTLNSGIIVDTHDSLNDGSTAAKAWKLK